jgi:Golgi nucleoside diphosphatase
MCEQNAENVVFGPSHHYTPQQRHDVKTHGPLGALDMGGSSTQIVYRSSKVGNDSDNVVTNEVEYNDSDIPSHLHHDDFYAVSYLSYGADQFRVRLWDLWVYEMEQRQQTDVESRQPINDISNIILNPCSFVGYTMEYRGYVFTGTGDAVQCSKEVNRLIPYHDDTIDLEELYDENMEGDDERITGKRKLVGGVEHPPIRGKFYGMSLYFFTLDCLRELSDPDHPIRASLLFCPLHVYPDS